MLKGFAGEKRLKGDDFLKFGDGVIRNFTEYREPFCFEIQGEKYAISIDSTCCHTMDFVSDDKARVDNMQCGWKCLKFLPDIYLVSFQEINRAAIIDEGKSKAIWADFERGTVECGRIFGSPKEKKDDSDSSHNDRNFATLLANHSIVWHLSSQTEVIHSFLPGNLHTISCFEEEKPSCFSAESLGEDCCALAYSIGAGSGKVNALVLYDMNAIRGVGLCSYGGKNELFSMYGAFQREDGIIL